MVKQWEFGHRRTNREQPAMLKRTTIDAIRTLNPTAAPDFLAKFPDEELNRYLDRLARVSHREAREQTGNRTGSDKASFTTPTGTPELF